eukprot:SAG22_NODE_98_length_20720_cov_17.226662_12_plen_45_part_00
MTKALSFCCVSTVFLSKTAPFRVILLPQGQCDPWSDKQQADGSP